MPCVPGALLFRPHQMWLQNLCVLCGQSWAVVTDYRLTSTGRCYFILTGHPKLCPEISRRDTSKDLFQEAQAGAAPKA